MTELRKSRLAESPWFWLALAIFWGLAAIAAIAPKYMRRQARLDQQQQARELAWRQRLNSAEANERLPDDYKGQGTRAPVGTGDGVWLPVAICCTLAVGVGGAWLLFARAKRLDPAAVLPPDSEASSAGKPETFGNP